MPEESRSAGRVRFGVFELDCRSGELRKAGVRVSLQEQALQVLTSLLERPGDLVTRDELRQRLWPTGTSGDFDHGLNAVINRLRDTLGDSADSPRFIETLPRRGYRFIAPIESDPIASPAVAPGAPVSVPEGPAASPSVRRRGGRIVAAFALGLVAVVDGGLWQLRRPPAVEGPPPKVVSLTRLAGEEDWPAFSPDGEQVAFSWPGEKSDNVDIYVTLVGATELRRLTTDPAVDYAPSWSPDGRRIAFLRAGGRPAVTSPWARTRIPRFQHIADVKLALLDTMDSASGSLHVMSALGGSDRRLTDLPVVGRVSWSPDGRYLAVGRAPSAASVSEPPGIYLIPTQGGESRPLTHAIPPSYDAHPAFSPDGRRLAYASCNRVAPCHLEVLDLDAGTAAAGPARRLPEPPGTRITGLAWTRDGQIADLREHGDVRRLPFVACWRRCHRCTGADRDCWRQRRTSDCLVAGPSGVLPLSGRHGHLRGRARKTTGACRGVFGPRQSARAVSRRSADRLLFFPLRRRDGRLGGRLGRLQCSATHSGSSVGGSARHTGRRMAGGSPLTP